MNNDLPKEPTGVYHPAVQIAQMVIQFLTMVFVFYTAHVGTSNNAKIEQVEQRQGEAADRTERVKVTLDQRMAEEVRSQGVQLYSTWKYLEDVAASSGQPRDQAKADEAKKLYEEHVRKHNGKS